MRNKWKAALLVTAVTSVVGTVAFATPTVGAWYNVVISTGTATQDINAHANVLVRDMEEDFSAHVSTDGASNVIQHEVKFSPGGTTGWHSHPGILLLTLAADSAPIDWYDARCGKTVYKAGDSWTEGTKLHDVVNRSSIDAHFLITYIVAQGVAKRTDQAAPKCAAALGLN